MEKRTVLAVALSFLVLIVYNNLFIKRPTVANQALNNSQTIDNKSVAIKQPQLPPALPKEAQEIVVDTSLEVTETIESNDVRIEISNIGAKVKSVLIKDQNYTIPITDVIDSPAINSVQFSVEDKKDNAISYVALINGSKIKKSFDISGNTLNVTVNVINTSEMSKLDNLKFLLFSINTNNITEKQVGYADRSLFEYSASSNGAIFRKHNANVFSKKEAKMHPGSVDWIGFRDRFYCAVFKPLFNIESYEIDPKTDKILNVYIKQAKDTNTPQSSQEYRFLAYFGHQDEAVLKAYNNGFEKIISFSNFGIIDGISRYVIKSMELIHKVIPSWGIAIIVICIIIYLLMYPLTMQGMKSMRKMQSLQPEMTRMREQYKNNPQRLNKEVMEIYKKNSVNPLAGCFPFILQMPVFIGLYQALWRNPDLNGATFLWIKDLSAPDRLFLFPGNLPFIGNEFNILPFLMMIVMYFQQKLSTKSMVTTDPAQLTQQKIMSIFFPIMLGVIFYKFSSGLTLYFTIFYLFSTFTQWKMSKVKVEVLR